MRNVLRATCCVRTCAASRAAFYVPTYEYSISLGGAGQPRDIGTVAAFFASDESSYLTGQSIFVDGGWRGK